MNPDYCFEYLNSAGDFTTSYFTKTGEHLLTEEPDMTLMKNGGELEQLNSQEIRVCRVDQNVNLNNCDMTTVETVGVLTLEEAEPACEEIQLLIEDENVIMLIDLIEGRSGTQILDS